jgi:hypothetical protein
MNNPFGSQLEQDIDTMHDVYMSPRQREAYDRIVELARAAQTMGEALIEAEKLEAEARENRPKLRFIEVPVKRDDAKGFAMGDAMQAANSMKREEGDHD